MVVCWGAASLAPFLKSGSRWVGRAKVWFNPENGKVPAPAEQTNASWWRFVGGPGGPVAVDRRRGWPRMTGKMRTLI